MLLGLSYLSKNFILHHSVLVLAQGGLQQSSGRGPHTLFYHVDACIWATPTC